MLYINLCMQLFVLGLFSMLEVVYDKVYTTRNKVCL